MNNIRTYYKPIQPKASIRNELVRYQEITPAKEIQEVVYCYWQLTSIKSLQENFNYRVVSDGCIDIFFECKQPAESYVMGFCRKYTEFPLGKNFRYFGVRFLPSAFPALFNVSAYTLSNTSQPLRGLLPELADWISSTIHPTSLKERVKHFNGKLTLFTSNKNYRVDDRFSRALKLIFERRGNLDTEKDLNVGLSPRQLRRIFQFYVGTSAKSFSNVVRFQHVLNEISSKKILREEKLYFDAGFYDQAHFIKNFKTFYGVTPTEAFR